MHFTALHRALGHDPGSLTEEMLDAAIAAGLPESGGLDWKDRLPPIKGLPNTDVPKDIASMANAAGGVIIYGVNEADKKATSRSDKATYDGITAELYERAYKSAAVSAIYPPVFGVELVEISTEPLAVAAIIPASVDGPHLIYKQDFFGAPVRNGADTVWMREGDIARMYRARFDEQRNATEALQQLYADAASAADGERAWVVCVARPRIGGSGGRFSKDEVRGLLADARTESTGYSQSLHGVFPLPGEQYPVLRPGLRRWTVPDLGTSASSRWKASVISVHHDGSVSLAMAVGGRPYPMADGTRGAFGGDQVDVGGIEAVVSDFCGMIRVVGAARGLDEYEVMVGLEWDGPLSFLEKSWNGVPSEREGVVRKYWPVKTTLRAGASDADFHGQVYALAEDCVQQTGAVAPYVVKEPARG